MPISISELLAGLRKLRESGREALERVMNEEFKPTADWCMAALESVQSSGNSILVCQTPIPHRIVKNKENGFSARKLQLDEEVDLDNATALASSTNSTCSVSVLLTDPPEKENKRKPLTRSSQRINASRMAKEENLHAISTSGTSADSKTPSIDALLTGPVERAPAEPINTNSSLEKKVVNTDHSSSTHSESSSIDFPIGAIENSKHAVKYKSALHEIRGTTESTTTLKGARPGARKLMRGAPMMSGSRPAPKKLLKGSSTPSKPAPASKKLLKGAASTSRPAPASKKPLRAATPTMSQRSGPITKKTLTGTPTSSGSSLAAKIIFKDTKVIKDAKTTQQNLESQHGDIRNPSKSQYVHQIAQEGFSHLAKFNDEANPSVACSSSVKHHSGYRDTRKTYLIDATCATTPVGSSDFTPDSQNEVAHVAEPDHQVKLDDVPLISLGKAIKLAKDSRESFAMGSSANATFVTGASDAANATFVIGSSDAANATFVIGSSDAANATFKIGSSDEKNATFTLESPDVILDSKNKVQGEFRSPASRETFVIGTSSAAANATFTLSFPDVILDSAKQVQKGLENLSIQEDPVKSGRDVHRLNKTTSVVKDPNATFEIASYDVTLDPEERTPLPLKNKDDYGLDDVCSEDSSDDEKNPKKVVPQWAQIANRQSTLHMQYEVSPLQMFTFFESTKTTPDLTKLFSNTKIDRRILNRRSSAVWLSPERKRN